VTETVRSFERGLRVIRAFGADARDLTLSEVARATDLNRATARRLILTLEELGYLRRIGDRFQLTPRVLDLGYAYIASFGLPQLALPFIEQLSETVNEASSVGVLDGTDIVYVARVPANRVMSVSIGLGTRFPAYRTSLGRAILASLDDDLVRSIWEASDRSGPTPRTVTSFEGLRAALEQVRTSGYALVDQELEVGVRSIAAALHASDGAIVGALNVSAHANRTSKAALRKDVAPHLLAVATQIEHALGNRLTTVRVRRDRR
jgi:IclR family transcriptional regulator, pca regulon regulatory protein